MDFKKALEDLITIIVNENGSDLHLSEGRHPMIRVDGFLIPLLKKTVLTREHMMGIMDVLVSKEQKETFLRDQEIDFSYGVKGVARFRGNGFIQQTRIAFALRLIPLKIRTIEELALPPILKDFTKRKQGFFLCVGPVGHGKTTTLAAMVDMINHERTEHIITIEDPIEYVYTPDKSIIDQREVRIDTSSFHAALRSTFRQDVDVILIGEMRGIETISTAVTAAETGHLVFSTLHTNDASQTIDRIIDSFPAAQQGQIRLQLAGSLMGIFSQRLLPRISGGLVPAYELLINNVAVANLIRESRTHEIPTIVETSSQLGMVDFNRSLIALIQAGDITVEDAYLHSSNPQLLEKLL
ncbi:MAG: twitching motility protein [Parcubacteria group bacterium Gr01-1014_48]|nr:MAG: twitching motility protein [Parcubacteria group bacterium Greene0416_14]TSC71927.1 MAG: twitching motility protein [Parcubacteria group bacterium Gr01-1014_48]TSD01098.1 MAG: twitching motility protein [Parcubacteria group bacterium Greene1014_15]TSD07968.1 MAG: twitching motility protein [Parcubacteria group bacterium Greene0714_4]